MRDYAKISPQFWISKQAREIRKLGAHAQLVAIYLMSCPSSTMIGIYYLPINLIAHETGIPFDEVVCILKGLSELGYCRYDFDMEYVWVVDMADEQVGGQLKQGDNRIKSINESYLALPDLPFLSEFFERYKIQFHLEVHRKGSYSNNFGQDNSEPLQSPLQRVNNLNTPPLEGPSKPLRSQEQEQEQEKEQEQEQEINIVAKTRRCDQFVPEISEIGFVFSHWKTIMQHPNAKLDEKRRKLIKSALKLGYTAEQVCNAITGCSYTPHNMGDNERGQRYDGLHVILRDADQIDRFIANFHSPPQPPNPADKLNQSNWIASQRWLNAKMSESSE